MKTVLLTGATGFLGSHLLEGLVQEDYNVVILKRSFSNTWRIDHLLDSVDSYDVDKTSLEIIFERHTIDVVIHTATTYGKGGERCGAIIDSNLSLPVKLVELSIEHNVSSFINSDSFLNIAGPDYRYFGCYILSKKQFLEWSRLLSDKVQIVHLTLGHIYGPKDNNDKFVPWLIREIYAGKHEIGLTKGEQTRDFVYVEDVVKAFLLVLQKRSSLPIYSRFEVGTGESISIRDFAVEVKKVMSDIYGKELPTLLKFGAIEYRDGELMESRLDSTSLKQLGWGSCVNLRDGLEKVIREILTVHTR